MAAKNPTRDFEEEPERLATSGCLMSIGSAAVTGLLLFVNGSFVLAVISALSSSGIPLIGNPQVSQFFLFTLPIGMVVVQWLMIDYVRKRLSIHRG